VRLDAVTPSHKEPDWTTFWRGSAHTFGVNVLKTLITAIGIAAALSCAQAADTDSAIVHYNGPVDGGAASPIHIPAGYVGTVSCSGPAGGTCVLVHSEPMKEPVPCDKPPFGDPPELFGAGKRYGLESAENNMATPLKAHSPTMTLAQAQAEMRKIVVEACEAKYHGGARTDFYSASITDHDFDTQLVFGLAMQYATVEIAHSAKGREEQAKIDARRVAAAAAGSPHTITYQSVSVRDFAIDGRQLSAKHARVEVSGFYIKRGDVPTLYATYEDLVSAVYSSGDPAVIPLMIDSASHEMRSDLFDCDSDPMMSRTGCRITARGRVGECVASNVFGAPREVPCLEVADGSRYRPPQPTAEELQRQKEEGEARQEAEKERLRQAELQWETSMSKCLMSPYSASIQAAAAARKRVDYSYSICANETSWPYGAMRPAQLPPDLQAAMDRCLTYYSRFPDPTPGYHYQLCTGNKPPPP